jgi:hypothetical protein
MIGKLSDIENVLELSKNFNKWAKKFKTTVVIVGFTAAYALYVHERVEMKWKGLPRGQGFRRNKDGSVAVPNKILAGGESTTHKQGFYWDPQGRGQAKFLEEPARTMSKELGRIVAEITKSTGSLEQGMLAAGLRLQREAMLRVPVDLGNLKASAFTRVLT